MSIAPSKASYLGCCHAEKWEVTTRGLDAFLDQQRRGIRDEEGKMIWPERSYISPGARRLCSLWQRARQS